MKAPVIHNKEELIKALRKCGKASADRCWDCGYYDREPWCEAALANDAANALESAEHRIADLETALAACRLRAEKGHECRFDCDFYDWDVGTCGGECVMLCEVERGEHDE